MIYIFALLIGRPKGAMPKATPRSMPAMQKNCYEHMNEFEFLALRFPRVGELPFVLFIRNAHPHPQGRKDRPPSLTANMIQTI